MKIENKVPIQNTRNPSTNGKSYTIQVLQNYTNVLSSNDKRNIGSNTLQNQSQFNNSSVDNDVNSTENKKP